MGEIQPSRLDLRRVVQRTADLRSPLEVELLATAQRNGDHYLDATDIDSCSGSSTPQSRHECHAARNRWLWTYRHRLIAQLIAREAPSLTSRVSDLSLDELTRMVTEEAAPVPDVIEMMDRLVRALHTHPKLHDWHGHAILVFVRIWLTLYTFRALHRQRVADGHPPIRDVDVEVFVEENLSRLEQDLIHIVPKDHPGEASGSDSAEAVYEHTPNELQLSGQLFKDPFYRCVAEREETFLANTIIHEFAHVSTDGRGKPRLRCQEEVAAEVLGYKAQVLWLGTADAGDFIRKQIEAGRRLRMEGLSPREGKGGVLRDVREIFLPRLNESALLAQDLFDLAQHELRDGHVNVGQRRRLEDGYARLLTSSRLQQSLYRYLSGHLAIMKRHGLTTLDDPAFVALAAPLFATVLSDWPQDGPALRHRAVGHDPMIVFVNYLNWKTVQFFHTYYTDGPAAGRRYLASEYAALLTQRKLLTFVRAMRISFDGISPPPPRP